MVSSSVRENQTWDEATHLAAGYAYWKLGDFRLNWEHPPLAKLLCAVPLLAVHPRLPLEHESWRTGDMVMFGAVFLYRNLLPPDTLLLLGRLPAMLMTLLLGLALLLWTRKHFGAVAALFALFLYISDPNIIAHGRYVTTDVAAALAIFLASIVWARFLMSKRWVDLAAAGIVLGLAVATKFSALFLLALFPLLYLIRWWQAPRRYSFRHFAASGVLAVTLAASVLLLIYWPETRMSLIEKKTAPLSAYIHRGNSVGRTLGWLADRFHLPAHAFLLGLDTLAEHNHRGHETYLLGKVSTKGRWYYFPVAFAVKTPTVVLALLGLCLVAGIGFLRRKGSLRAAPFPWIVVTVSPTVYFLFSMASNLNLGLRHILPVYPFPFVLVAAVLFRKPVRKPVLAVIVLLVGLQVYEHARIHPHYLAFFNTLAGGPAPWPAAPRKARITCWTLTSTGARPSRNLASTCASAALTRST